jgi:hypothetical protein
VGSYLSFCVSILFICVIYLFNLSILFILYFYWSVARGGESEWEKYDCSLGLATQISNTSMRLDSGVGGEVEHVEGVVGPEVEGLLHAVCSQVCCWPYWGIQWVREFLC